MKYDVVKIELKEGEIFDYNARPEWKNKFIWYEDKYNCYLLYQTNEDVISTVLSLFKGTNGDETMKKAFLDLEKVVKEKLFSEENEKKKIDNSYYVKSKDSHKFKVENNNVTEKMDIRDLLLLKEKFEVKDIIELRKSSLI